MPERILTQEEIDALAKAVKEGKIKPRAIRKKVTPYDFKHEIVGTPKTFQQAQIEFAKHLSNYFVSKLRLPITVELASAPSSLGLADYIESRPSPSYIAVVRLEPLQGYLFFNMKPWIVAAIVDVLCGGTGDVPRRTEITELEKSMLGNIVLEILDLQRRAWSARGIDFTPKLDIDEIDPALVHPMATAETSTVVMFDLIRGKTRIEEGISMAFPVNLLRSLTLGGTARARIRHGITEVPREWKETLQYELRETVNAPAIALIGTTQLTIRELLDLEEGDILMLRESPNQPIKVIVGDRVKFLAKPGVSNGKRAIKIVKVIRGEYE